MGAPLHRSWNVVLVVAFAAVLALPGAAMLAGVDRDVTAGENRALAPLPSLGLDWPSLRALPWGASRYFEDHFGFRARLVRWQATLRLRYLHASPSPDVIVGDRGWLYYAADGGIEAYAAAVPLSRDELELWRRTLQHTQDWLARRGVAYLFVIAPDKDAIYPEHMPASVRRVGGESRTDALVRYLHDHSDVHVLDLRPSLLHAKARERVFHRTDTHWNERGAFTAYQEIVRALGAGVAGPPRPRESFDAKEETRPGMDLAGMLGLSASLHEVNLVLVPRAARDARIVEPAHPDAQYDDARLVTERTGPPLPRAVVFRDSFGSALVPFLSEHFSRAVYLWQYNMDPDVVAAERPRVVIQEWVGRRLSTLLPYDPFGAEGSASRSSAERR